MKHPQETKLFNLDWKHCQTMNIISTNNQFIAYIYVFDQFLDHIYKILKFTSFYLISGCQTFLLVRSLTFFCNITIIIEKS